MAPPAKDKVTVFNGRYYFITFGFSLIVSELMFLFSSSSVYLFIGFCLSLIIIALNVYLNFRAEKYTKEVWSVLHDKWEKGWFCATCGNYPLYLDNDVS